MKQNLKKAIPTVITICLILVLFQTLTSLGIIKDFVIPAPSAVIKALVTEHSILKDHIITTTLISILGLAIAIPFGALTAILLHQTPILYRAFYPLIIASQTIPTIVITPIIVIMFGFGVWPRLLVVILVCFFPLTISFLQGLAEIDPDILRLMKTMDATTNQTLYHVLVPGALPSFFAGLKISATYSVTSAVLSEWSGSGLGLGIYLMRTKRSYAYDKMFASIVWIIGLSLIIYFAVILLEYLIIPQKKYQTVNSSK